MMQILIAEQTIDDAVVQLPQDDWGTIATRIAAESPDLARLIRSQTVANAIAPKRIRVTTAQLAVLQHATTSMATPADAGIVPLAGALVIQRGVAYRADLLMGREPTVPVSLSVETRKGEGRTFMLGVFGETARLRISAEETLMMPPSVGAYTVRVADDPQPLATGSFLVKD